MKIFEAVGGGEISCPATISGSISLAAIDGEVCGVSTRIAESMLGMGLDCGVSPSEASLM
jgi:hypothetical protein